MTNTYTTTAFKTLVAQQFYDLLDSQSNAYLPDSKQTNMYLVMGRQIPWNTGDEVVPSSTQTPNEIFEYYKTAIAAKKLSYNNTSFVIPRRDWTSGTVYSQYDCSCGLMDILMNFYVRNSQDQVFKCLYNKGGLASTVEPILSLSTASLEEPYFSTSDGYKWKYMYTISSVQKQKFMTQDWMPVYVNKFVSNAAVNGSIDIVEITNPGNNYTNGSLQDIITVTGDGTDAVMKAEVVDNKVTDIIIQNRGKNYTTANLTFTDVTGGVGTSAAATVKIVPQNGHGYDPIFELYAKTLMVTVDVSDESGLVPTSNDFRQVFLLHNPVESSTQKLATGDVYTLYTTLQVSPGIGSFSGDEIVYQGNTLETAYFTGEVVYFDYIQNKLYLNNVKGTLRNNDTIKGVTTGAIRVVSSVKDPSMKLYSGKILYILNMLPSLRDIDQTDKFRFLLSF